MTIQVRHLFQAPRYRPVVADWIYGEFWQGKGGFDASVIEGFLSDATDPDAVPLSLLATVRGCPAGTVNLIENDDPKRPQLRPWLAALYVVPEFRRIGVASVLVKALIDHAVGLGEMALYLGTDIPGFYQRFGAEVIDRVDVHHVMILRLNDSIGTPVTSG